MVFSSAVFVLLFLPTLLGVYYLIPARRRGWRNVILLVFSLGFYAYGEPKFVWVMLAAITVNWALGLLLERSVHHRKMWLVTAIAADVGLLAIFKYVSFLSENLARISANKDLLVKIALPIGISFFTFQLMSYIFDVYYKKSSAQKNPLNVALYIALFPQLIAGPIVRYQQVADEITGRRETFDDVTIGMQRFIYGLGKKVLIANYMAQIADNVFDYAENPCVMTAWLGVIAYTLQIYFDFSGYSDMAIGLGRMFGFHFSENFRYPYIAKSVTEFWRRWHISLSTWFRDYVYIPLGGNRVAKPRWVLNLLTVWLLTGIWHGANWTFVLWGLLYFVLLLFEKCIPILSKAIVVSRIYTMTAVMLVWVFFRSPDIASAGRYIGRMFGSGGTEVFDGGFFTYWQGTYVLVILAIVGATPLVSKIFAWLRAKRMVIVEQIWLLAVFGVSLVEIVSSTYNPFIYFNF